MSALIRYFNNLPAEFSKDEVIKIVRARELIASLPASTHGARDFRTVPDIRFKMRFPKFSGQLPQAIREFIGNSPDREILSSEHLLGLCLNGRELPVELFINDRRIHEKDASGNLLEEIVWHEYLHGAEGIDADNAVCRETPWSYRLQEDMRSLENGDRYPPYITERSGSAVKTHALYMRRGTHVQQNVSEMLARVGVLYLKQIRSTGVAPIPETAFDFLNRDKLSRCFNGHARHDTGLCDLAIAIDSYGQEAQDLFWDCLPEMVARISSMYGYPEPGA